MTLHIVTEAPPLRIDEHGVVRVGNTRVPLETVIGVYLDGYTPDQIVSAFPTLTLAHIHATIAYYLQHRAEVDAYIQQVEAAGEAIRQKYADLNTAENSREQLQARLKRVE